MMDVEVANINTDGDFESLEGITVYEVVTEYENIPLVTNADYPHILLQLRDGHIINIANGEVFINLSQFTVSPQPYR